MIRYFVASSLSNVLILVLTIDSLHNMTYLTMKNMYGALGVYNTVRLPVYKYTQQSADSSTVRTVLLTR